MKKNTRKGFTITELVIVIAVIAILAAVLIPTFSGIIAKANKSATLQEARSKYTEAYADDIEDGVIDGKAADGEAVDDTNYSYDSTNKVAKYTYTARDYTATFDGTDWEVN